MEHPNTVRLTPDPEDFLVRYAPWRKYGKLVIRKASQAGSHPRAETHLLKPMHLGEDMNGKYLGTITLLLRTRSREAESLSG